MKRDYYLLWSVLDLMHPKQLDVRDIVVAARLARGLQEMQADFDRELLELQKKHKLRLRPNFALPTPSTEGMAELFTLSFFKIVSTTPKGKKKDDGWFSGEPDSWKNIAQSIQTIDVNKLPNMVSSYIATLIKLFKPFGSTFLPPQNDSVNYSWDLPPSSFKHYKDAGWYDEEDDDGYYDNYDDPFDDDKD